MCRYCKTQLARSLFVPAVSQLSVEIEVSGGPTGWRAGVYPRSADLPSGAIIDRAESKSAPKPFKKPAHRGEGIEGRGDAIIGIHVRRLAFAELLPNYSHFVKPAVFYRASGWRRLVGHIMWPMAWRVMMRMYDIRPGAASESR